MSVVEVVRARCISCEKAVNSLSKTRLSKHARSPVLDLQGRVHGLREQRREAS